MAGSREKTLGVAAAVVAAAAVAAVALLVPGPGGPTRDEAGQPVDLPEVRVPEPHGALARARARDRDLLQGFQPGEDGERVLERFRAFNRMEHGCLADDRREELYRMRAELVAAAGRYLERAGLKGFQALGRMALERFEASFGKLVAAGDDPEAFATAAEFLRPWAGGLIEDGLTAGLLEGKAEGPVRLPAGREATLRALYLARWFRFLEPRYPLDEVLDGPDRATLLRWKIAGSRTATVEQRLEAVKKLAALDPRFRAHQAAGLLHARAGRLELARGELEAERRQGGSPDTERALKWVERALKEQGR